MRRYKKTSLRFYRARFSHAFRITQFGHSSSSKHQHHACLRCRPSNGFIASFQHIIRTTSRSDRLENLHRGGPSDQNDINEETAMQPELINQSLAELQMKKQRKEKPQKPIGFIQPKEGQVGQNAPHQSFKFISPTQKNVIESFPVLSRSKPYIIF